MSASNATQYDELHQSYGRCLNSGPFITRFYEIFLASHPDVPVAFAKTDFDRQRRLLRRTLTTAIMYAAGSDIVASQVDRMAEIHSRKGHAPVQPHLYQYWLDSLMAAIREHDPKLDAELEDLWRQAMMPIVDRFTSCY